MKKVSDKDLDKLKDLADNAIQDWEFKNISARSSEYLSIETIKKLNLNTRNNILFTLLGGFLGFLSSITVAYYTKVGTEQDLQQLKKQLHELSLQQNDFQKYFAKKDSSQIFSKKN